MDVYPVWSFLGNSSKEGRKSLLVQLEWPEQTRSSTTDEGPVTDRTVSIEYNDKGKKEETSPFI